MIAIGALCGTLVKTKAAVSVTLTFDLSPPSYFRNVSEISPALLELRHVPTP